MSGPAKGHGLEAIAVRRAKLADAGKVRYRVYKTKDDYIAVIAESALMAVKVAGVTDPYRIVRDLPTEEITLQAERIAKQEEVIDRVSLPTTAHMRGALKAELKAQTPSKDKFVPIKAGDLQKRSALQTRIISSEMMNALLEKKQIAASAPAPMSKRVPPTVVIPPPVAVQPEPPLAPAPEPSPPPPPVAAAPEAPAAATSPEVLSPEEVAKLLNG